MMRKRKRKTICPRHVYCIYVPKQRHCGDATLTKAHGPRESSPKKAHTRIKIEGKKRTRKKKRKARDEE